MKRLRKLMSDEGITQAELAAGIGKSQPFVSKLLLGQRHPSEPTLESILDWHCVRLGRRVTFEQIRDTNPPEDCR